MQLHHLRSATFIIETANERILVDPMLGAKGSIPPFSVLRFKAQKNPTVDLPYNANALLNNISHCVITHSHTFNLKALQHLDHLDRAGEQLLRSRAIPVTAPDKDTEYLRKKLGLNVAQGLIPWQPTPFLGGKITAVPCQHGHGWIHSVMANGYGFFIELPNEPSLYISGDTVLTDDVKRALTELKPDIAILAAGRAQMDVGQPLLMSTDELIEFVRLAPNKVVANHLEALNHCPITREQVQAIMQKAELSERVLIPFDGETLSF